MLRSSTCALVVASLGLVEPVLALSITSTANGGTLQSAILGGIGGLTIQSVSVAGQSAVSGELSTGTYTNASGTYGIGAGVVISTGNVATYGDGPNTQIGATYPYFAAASAADEALLDPITGGTFDHFDVTRLDITFDASPSVGNIFFTIVFGSEEFPEFVGSNFIDGFGIYFNGTNVAIAAGSPVNINHPSVAAIPGTELDAVVAPGGNPLLVFQIPVTPGSTNNTLTFIVADTSDEVLDTTVYISGLGSVNPVPEPNALVLLAVAAIGLASAWRRGSRPRRMFAGLAEPPQLKNEG